MASQSTHAGKKRRAEGPPNVRSAPKRRKPDIPTEHVSKGEINIANFVKAREFEIKALEKNMRDMRKSLSSRAFQQVPRHMRRRTASHNVKKVPRRLRKRALREMREDNTPTVSKRTRAPSRKLRLRLETAKSLKKLNQRSKTVRQKKKEAKAKDKPKETDPEKQVEIVRVPKIKKNIPAKPPTATTKYRRRQVNKTWLPTHLWHTKRAHMTRPIEPLWNLAIPLRPTEKSYRPSHRAAGTRGCIAWDTSYMSTVACLGTDHTLLNMLEALGFAPATESVAKMKRWKSGTRFAEGYCHMIDGAKSLLGPMLVLWVGSAEPPAKTTVQEGVAAGDAAAPGSVKEHKKVKLDRKIFIRVHPSFFKDFWTHLLRAAKSQKPQVLVEDLRFEIGSIHITGPASTEALLAVLKPRHPPSEEKTAVKTWASLAGLSNPGSLPDRTLMPLEIVDPRLSHPPKQVKVPSDSDSLNRLTELIATWPPDQNPVPTSLATHKARWIASTRLPSQKSINRRRAEAGPGKSIPVLDKDPQIPVLLLSHRAPNRDSNSQGSWTVLLPWCCVDAVWRSLLYYPIATGGTPRFGGLYQTQQIAFEQLVPWFPADMPGTAAGKAWERTQSEKRFDAWIRRPPSRRMRWELVDLGLGRKGEVGRGWCCDWEYLFKDTVEMDEPPAKSPEVEPESIEVDAQGDQQEEERGRRRNTSSPETTPEPEAATGISETEYNQVAPPEAAILLKPTESKGVTDSGLSDIPAIATVRIRLLTKGTPQAGARIYRLPQPDKIAANTATQPSSAPVQSSLPASAVERSNAGVVLAQPEPAAPQPSTPTPSLPASAEVHTSTYPSTTTTISDPPTSASHAPSLAAQRPPTSLNPSSTAFSTLPQPNTPTTQRAKWLSLVPPTFYASHHKPSNTNHTARPLPKPATNHRNLPSKPTVHAAGPDDFALSRLSVLPRNAPQAIVDEYAAKPLSPAEQEAWARAELLRELARGENLGAGEKWDVEKGLVECPDKEELVGFVTSGGYNLGEGRGTAVGGLWVQRVREGWRVEDEEERKGEGGAEGKKLRERRVRERRLCVVRNAGEAVGRLGVWEVC
ncbi:uncharacterized protein HMPREF1541_04521 [Cyphellophora europaea CBS 101466]|uniref:Uncharacterized protein n=1 Tax=Cyphellophora europaea (strain CBS 101466) TaxID=1220924 RepID=W2RVA5_CYPE1|nr:uncharacterized protein HMPREF1541_04521 [Cyphellophora europaea CBS 101466]ETN40245.1 hypothetical protein HMPREF1541_04521 [Cyphellophora europaea CBS 101466]